ncbi:MAG: nucleoside hydrolase [Oscillospiraceae bacterium]|nr:nucleoside hydrolase [Oscillospiraceae bacterium]
MKKIIFDCDNTMGISGRPMDDALALLYLLGRSEEAEILGICCNAGNGTAQEVYTCCRHLLDESGWAHIPLYRGCEGGDPADSEGARFLSEAAATHAGELCYLGIGSLTNLYGAFLLDGTIFDKLSQIVLMGGITEPLFIHDQPLAELNFSLDPVASACVLSRGRNVSVITGNNCLPVSYLPKDEFMPQMCLTDNPAGMYIAQKCGYRFADKKISYGAEGSYCWDGVAAVYLLHPELFDPCPTRCRISETALQTGFLDPSDEGSTLLQLPRARDRLSFQKEQYSGWLSLRMGKAAFSCKGMFLDKLLQPAILVTLAKAPCHGFRLLQLLKADGLIDGELDPAGLYRTLKRMEAEGYLSSTPDKTSAKPRRIFALTELGRYSLKSWELSLLRYQDHIQQILNAMPGD